MWKIEFYVPVNYADRVTEAMFNAGAGRIGSYDKCCWMVEGKGQFRSCMGSHPFIGERNRLEELQEYKVEMVCEEVYLKSAIEALLSEHPYETPAYGFFEIKVLENNFQDQ